MCVYSVCVCVCTVCVQCVYSVCVCVCRVCVFYEKKATLKASGLEQVADAEAGAVGCFHPVLSTLRSLRNESRSTSGPALPGQYFTVIKHMLREKGGAEAGQRARDRYEETEVERGRKSERGREREREGGREREREKGRVKMKEDLQGGRI